MIKGVEFYQKIPRIPRCRFVPSCSDYAIYAMKKEGLKGVLKTISRIARCNPFSQRRIDL